jgi:hypothetical protein
MRCVCIVELRVTVNNTKILSVAQPLLWRIYVASNNVTYVGHHVKWPIYLSDCNKIWIFLDRFS